MIYNLIVSMFEEKYKPPFVSAADNFAFHGNKIAKLGIITHGYIFYLKGLLSFSTGVDSRLNR